MSNGPLTGDDPRETAEPAVADLIVSAPRAAARARWAEIAFVVALCIYTVLAVFAHRYAYFAWDLALARRIQSVSLPGFHWAMVDVSILGNGFVPWLLVVGTGLALAGVGLRLEGLVCVAGTA